MHLLRFLVLAPAILLWAAGCLIAQPEHPAVDRSCAVDDDCVIVDLACSNNGGYAVATNVSSAPAVEATRPSVAMPGVSEAQPFLESCAAEDAVCVVGQCTLQWSGFGLSSSHSP